MNNLAYELVENYKKYPDKIVIIDKNEQITYKNLYTKVANFKEHLLKKGIRKGKKVLVLVQMSKELYIALLSLWSIGAIPCFMDAGFIKGGMKNNEFDSIEAVIGTKKYILYSNINNNLKKLNTKINVSIINKLKIKDMLEVQEVDKDSSAILTYTSGTTGKPKIASRSHEFLKCQGKILINTLNYEKEDIEISSIPIFTLYNISAGITTLIAQANFSNLGKTNAKKIINQIIRHKVNRIMAAPGLLQTVIKYALKNNIQIENVKKIFTGGGAVFIDLINNIKKVFPKAKIITLYGSTEAEPISECDVTDISKSDLEKIRKGYGILAGNIIGVKECKLIKNDRKEIGKITTEEFKKMQVQDNGEIVVTGENVLKGYVGGIGDRENKFYVEEEIFHRTGDLGSFDEKGRLWLKGRIKEPYFNIESALHSKFKNIGKTAVLKNDNKITIVLEKCCKISIEKIKKEIDFEKIENIIYVKKIPVDKRHNTKVDYNELRKVLKI